MGNEVRLIGCRDCDAYNCEGCNIYTLSEMLRCGDFDCMMDEHHSIVRTPESLRPKGEWTVIEGDYWNEDVIYQCSVCKEEFVSFDGANLEKLWNYCPECGAKMEGCCQAIRPNP